MIFFGSGILGRVVLEMVLQCTKQPTLVVTQSLNDPVAAQASAAGVRVVAPEKLEELKPLLAPTPDHFLVASYGKILPHWLLSIPTHGALNLHPSLLPKYRGPSPLQATILNGDMETGVTLMVMDEKMDHGPILGNIQFLTAKAGSRCGGTISKFQTITKIELETELARLGAKLYFEKIDAWLAGKILPVPQDETQATYTKIVHRDDGRIDWSKSAEEADRMRRAYDPWPGIWTKWHGKRLKILQATPSTGAPVMTPGTVLTYGAHGVAVVCGEKSMYQLSEVQLEGKKPMDVVAFTRGQKSFMGTQLH